MNTHPDADGFLRSILADPTDPTPRLIFADWLDETGRPENAAWAEYIRTCTDGNSWRTADLAARIEARLTLPVATLARRLPDLFELLPPQHFAVRIGDEMFPRELIEECPESVARESLAFPIWFEFPHVRDVSAMVFAAARPTDPGLAWRLGFILARQVFLVAAEQDDILAAVNRHYGLSDTESVDSVLVEFFDPNITIVGPEPPG